MSPTSDGEDSPREWRRRNPLAPFFKRPRRPSVPEGARNFVRAKLTGDPRVRVRDYVKMPRTIQTIDKVSFTLGVVGLMLTQFVATEHPEYFWFYYLCSAPLVFIYRIIMYRMIKYHYFLIDFCYYANLACFVHILGAPTSGRLFRSVFAYSNGPILWAIPLWRNSLVFHSHDKVQSVFIHTAPAILTWCTRWYGQGDLTWSWWGLGDATGWLFAVREGDHGQAVAPGLMYADVAAVHRAPNRLTIKQLTMSYDVVDVVREFYVYPVVGYLIWQVIYLVITELFYVKRLDNDPELVTSLRWLANDYKAPVTRWALRTSRRVGLFAQDELFDHNSLKTKFVFVSLQLVYTMVTFLPIPMCYASKAVHTTVMLLVFLSCIWNGAEYYIDIFSRRYAKKFDDGTFMGSVRDDDNADAAVAETVLAASSGDLARRSGGGDLARRSGGGDLARRSGGGDLARRSGGPQKSLR